MSLTMKPQQTGDEDKGGSFKHLVFKTFGGSLVRHSKAYLQMGDEEEGRLQQLSGGDLLPYMQQVNKSMLMIIMIFWGVTLR